MQKSKTEDQLMLVQITLVASHREVVRALIELQKKYQIEEGSGNFIQYFISSYISEVSKIIHDFEHIIDKNENIIVAINPEAHYKNTPKLVDMILDFILILTDEKPKDRGWGFTFE